MNKMCAKAYYRSALALLALERLDEALDCCDRCLAFDPNNAGMNTVRERAVKAQKGKEAREQIKEERIRKEQEEKRILAAAYRVSIP